MVTSGTTVDVVNHLHKEKIIWAPDKYLGDFVQRQTGADMLMGWFLYCSRGFKAQELGELISRTLRLRLAHQNQIVVF